MIVQEITLTNFRNHALSHLFLGDGINLLLGRNGQGKTNVVEAISYLGLTKSFYAATDANVLRVGAAEFSVEGVLAADSGLQHTVRIAFRAEPPEKQVLINGSRPESLGSVIGRFPVVVLSSEHGSITAGGPAERRRFLDVILSQVSSSYLQSLMQYRKILRQRNRLLAGYRAGERQNRTQLEPWTESLIESGSQIIARRAAFLQEYRPYVEKAHRNLVQGGEEVVIAYVPCIPPDGDAAAGIIAKTFREAIERNAAEELRRGVSLVGPHRDDLQITLDTLAVQQYASQGQHKTILVAMKLAEHAYLCDYRHERPVLLLDDLFSELDEDRSRAILEAVRVIGQCAVTTTEEIPFQGTIPWDGHHRKFVIDRGTVEASA